MNYILGRALVLLVMVTALLGTCLPSLAQGADPIHGVVPFWANSGVYTVNKISSPINIDGKLDESAWANAAKIVLVIAAGKDAPITATFARMLYDDNNLYFAAELEDHDLTGDNVGHDPTMGEDDVIELFVKPDSKDPGVWQPGYWEFHVAPTRMTRDYFWARRSGQPGRQALAPESGMNAAVALDGTVNYWQDYDKGYTVEMSVPLSAFDKIARRPQAGDRWKFLVARYDYSVYSEPGLEHSASAYLSRLNYHLYEDYPYMVFGK